MIIIHKEGNVTIRAECDGDEGLPASRHDYDSLLKELIVGQYWGLTWAQIRGFFLVHPSIQGLDIWVRDQHKVCMSRTDFFPKKEQTLPEVKIHSPDAMMQLVDNLHDVIQRAGGLVCCYSTNRLKEMTAFELLNNISTNGIKFTHKGK